MKYIRIPGDPQGRPPYRGTGILMHGGLIAAHPANLQALCDLTLNGVDADLRFEAVGDHILYAALYARKMSSDHPQDKQFGGVPENDIGLWLLTWGGRVGQPAKLRWMPAFIFVDSASALMTGRELYGYPKQFGRMIRRSSADSDFSVSLRAVAFEKQDPNEMAREHEVLRVERGSLAANAEHAKADLGFFFAGRQRLADAEGPWAQPIKDVEAPFLGMPMVFLRQMRDVAAEDEASVQEIATVTVAPIGLPSGGGLAGAHRIILADLASFPIAKTLGCAPNAPIEFPFWARFDFEVGVGEPL